MNKFSDRLPIYLVSLAALFIVLFGIRATAPILNPILLAMVITITVLPIPGHLTRRGLPGWLALVLTILVVVLLMALVIATVFGANHVAARLAFDHGASVAAAVSARSAFTALFLLLLLKAKSVSLAMDRPTLARAGEGCPAPGAHRRSFQVGQGLDSEPGSHVI